MKAEGTSFEPSEASKGVVVDAALGLAETQLLAQVADDASLDGRATGLIGFNGALLAAAIAAKELLGGFWLAPIGVVVVATGMLLYVLYGGQRPHYRRDNHDQTEPAGSGLAVGVHADEFYETYSSRPTLDARERFLVEIDRPTKIKTCQRKAPASQSRPVCQTPGSNKSAPAAKSPKAKQTGNLLRIARGIEGNNVDGTLVKLAEQIEANER